MVYGTTRRTRDPSACLGLDFVGVRWKHTQSFSTRRTRLYGDFRVSCFPYKTISQRGRSTDVDTSDSKTHSSHIRPKVEDERETDHQEHVMG